tara:strand:+ start:1394 stop:1756 length:363 start_codon:yes stop_codon:yes gene_type:complete
MPLINITLPTNVLMNVSIQPGDTLYYINADQNIGGFTTHNASDEIIEIGPVLSINGNQIQCDIPVTTPDPDSNSFILFGKDRAVNESSIVGYYGKFKFKNNSKDKAELFATGCEVLESSK